jgi:hypothetical protein
MKVALPITLLVLLTGCADNPAFDRSVLVANSASQVLQVLDQEVAPLYEQAAADALERLPAGSTVADYQRAMEHWNRLEQALRTAHSALLVMQGALKAWDAGSSGSEADYGQALACVVEGLRAVAEASKALGLDLKPEILEFLAVAGDAARSATGGCDGN